MLKNKQARADLESQNFWGITIGLWLFCIIVIWKLSFMTVFSLKEKIIITIVSAPLIFGICYLMGTEGD